MAVPRRALPDRARLTTSAPATPGRKVDGRTVRSAPGGPGPWFRCRLNVAEPAAEDAPAGRGSRPRAPQRPSLLYETKAMDAPFAPIQLGAGDELEVVANNVDGGATVVWQVEGPPLVIRKRVRLFGNGLANVKRVTEGERQ